MEENKRQSDIYCALAWAIFTLGATQLVLVLVGPLVFLITMFCCSGLFAFFLFKVQPPSLRSFKSIVRPYSLCVAVLAIGNVLYLEVVFLQIDASQILFVTLHILIYIIPLVATIPFLRKPAHVSQ